MKTKLLMVLTIAASLFFASCSKNNNAPDFIFANNSLEGQANANGEYTITGTLTSEVNLSKVTLTKEGQNTSFLVDESEAKNKNTYAFSYLVTGINENTYILINAFDQNGGKKNARFLIKK